MQYCKKNTEEYWKEKDEEIERNWNLLVKKSSNFVEGYITFISCIQLSILKYWRQ